MILTFKRNHNKYFFFGKMPLRDFFMSKKFIVWHIHLFKRHTLPIQGNRDIIWLELKTIMRGMFSCYVLPLCCAFHISYVFQSHIVFLRHNQGQKFWYSYYSSIIFMHMHLHPSRRSFIFENLPIYFVTFAKHLFLCILKK